MRQKLLYRIRVRIQERSNRQDKNKLSLFLRVRPLWNTDKEFTVGANAVIDAKKWDSKNKGPKGKSEEANDVYQLLMQYTQEIYYAWEEYLSRNETPNMAEFKSYVLAKVFNRIDLKETEWLVRDALANYSNKFGKEIGEKRKSRYLRVRQMVDAFHKEKFGKVDVGFNVLNRAWWSEFTAYVSKNYNIGDGTFRNYQKVLKAAIHSAMLRGMLNSDPFVGCNLMPEKEHKLRSLSTEELNRLKAFRCTDTRLELARDLFLFVTNTGLSYSDLLTLSSNDFIVDKQGKKYISKDRVKTSVNSYVPLSKEAEAILNKYKAHPAISGTESALPVINLNDYNSLLKILGAHCNVRQKMSSHLARHTFATVVWVQGGGTLEGLQRVLGHKKIQTTMIYGKASNDKVDKEADMVFGSGGRARVKQPR